MRKITPNIVQKTFIREVTPKPFSGKYPTRVLFADIRRGTPEIWYQGKPSKIALTQIEKRLRVNHLTQVWIYEYSRTGLLLSCRLKGPIERDAPIRITDVHTSPTFVRYHPVGMNPVNLIRSYHPYIYKGFSFYSDQTPTEELYEAILAQTNRLWPTLEN